MDAPAGEYPENEGEQAREERDDQGLDLQQREVALDQRLAGCAQVEFAYISL